MRGVTRDRIGKRNKEFHIVVKLEKHSLISCVFYEANKGSLSECLDREFEL